MKQVFAAALIIGLLASTAAVADGIKYFEDPPYVKVNKDEPHPLEDLMALADQGDVRGQFILADLYGKGKGGLGKNRVIARYWFETAARHGYTPAFIRLAALAKHSHDEIEAYQWYTLDANHASGKEAKWSKTSLEQLAKTADLSKDDIAEAKKGAKDWLAAQDTAMKEINKREEAARAAAAAVAAATPGAGGGAETGDNSKDDAGAAERTAAKEQPKPKKEYHFNE